MKDKKILSLKEELEEEARQMDEEVAADPAVQNLKVPKEVDEMLAQRIAAYEAKKKTDTVGRMSVNAGKSLVEKISAEQTPVEMTPTEPHLSEEDQKALEIGRQILAEKSPVVTTVGEINKPHKIKHKKILFALVAVLVLVCAIGMTSMGNHSYWKEVWEKVTGKQTVTVTNTKDSETTVSEKYIQADVYKEIEDSLDANIVWPKYLPEGMTIFDFNLEKNQNYVAVLYSYQKQTIKYSICSNVGDSSYAQEKEGTFLSSFNVLNAKQNITVNEYSVKDSESNRYIADFEYLGIRYQLKGVISKAEFKKIVENLKYF